MSTVHNEEHNSLGPYEYEVKHTTPLFIREPALRALLIIALSGVTLFGVRSIFSIFPHSAFMFFGIYIFVALVLLFLKVFSVYERQILRNLHAQARNKEAEEQIENARGDLHRAMLFLLYMDTHLWDKIHTGDTELTDYPYDTPCTKDIALGLILTRLNKLSCMKDTTKDALQHALQNLFGYEETYDLLQLVDSYVLLHIPQEIMDKYERIVFSLRYSLLKFVFDAREKDCFPSFLYDAQSDYYMLSFDGKTPCRRTRYRGKDKIVIDFFYSVLNDFFPADGHFKKHRHEFDEQLFECYFTGKSPVSAIQVKDLQERISYYGTTIKELEESIADINVRIHDLEVVLNALYAEYNARVGILYVELDRLKLRIREYKHRIARAQGRNLTEQEAREMEEEMDELFSDEREKIEGLEDEAHQSSREYEKNMEEDKDEYTIEFMEKIKALFRKLVFKFHPDMAQTEKEKRKFHKIFIKIKEAYERRDIKTLIDIMKKAKIKEAERSETPQERLERLKKEHERLESIYGDLKMKLQAMQKSELNRLKEQIEEARDEDRDLLQELADAAEKEIEILQEELDELKEKYNESIMQSV
jgi:hypothetical protein